jgi:dTDP-glucose 4,6-dehydratase
MVEGLVRLASSDERLPVNLGNPLELTILEFAERIKRVMHAEIKAELPIVFEPLPDTIRKAAVDIGKLAGAGVGAQGNSCDGLRQIVEYFKALTVTRQTAG